ncbi:MAG TPA: glycosyltransferase family 39 protein [Polyangiales bacterium]
MPAALPELTSSPASGQSRESARSPAALTLPRVLVIAVALRVAWLLLCPNEPVSDQYQYHALAKAIAEGRGYVEPTGAPAGLWPVGYPALLAAVYVVFGPHYLVSYLANIALGVALVAGTYRFAQELFGERAGALAGLLVALHPTLVMHTTMFASEAPFMAGLIWLCWLLLRVAKSGVAWPWAAPVAGVAIGLLVYVRPTAQVLLLCLPGFGLLFHRFRLLPLLLATAVVVACAITLLIPWGVRNQRAFGVFSLTSLNGGENIWAGNNPDSAGKYMELPAETRGMGLVEKEALLGQRGKAYIRSHPGRYLTLCAARLLLTLRSDTIGAAWNTIGITRTFGEVGVFAFKTLCTLVHWVLLGTLGYVLFRLRKRLGKADLALLLVIALVAAPFVLIVGGNRYMIPLLPLFCIWIASIRRDAPAPQTATVAA